MAKKLKKGMSLELFINETRVKLNEFAEKYHKEHIKNPEGYPLELPANNSGLWLEFFY